MTARAQVEAVLNGARRVARNADLPPLVELGGAPPAEADIPFVTLDELQRNAQSITWLVKRVLPSAAIGMLFGGSQTFKTFIALDLALHIAHGLPWMGRRTRKGPVIYIAAEGGAGIWRRIEAWHRARGLRWQDIEFRVVPAAVDLGADASKIVAKAEAVQLLPALVVVDTVSQTYAGEENSAGEMAAYLRELGRQFRDMWRCAVLLIHHTGHQATERPRGSSALTGNPDFLFGAHRDEKEMLATLSCFKQKEDERFADETFSLTVHQLGTDSDGDPVTTLVARHLSNAEEVQQAQQAEQLAGRGGRAQVLMTLVQNGMTEKALRKAFYEDCGIDEYDVKKHAFYRARDWAVRQRLIEIAEGLVIDLRKGK